MEEGEEDTVVAVEGGSRTAGPYSVSKTVIGSGGDPMDSVDAVDLSLFSFSFSLSLSLLLL